MFRHELVTILLYVLILILRTRVHIGNTEYNDEGIWIFNLHDIL